MQGTKVLLVVVIIGLVVAAGAFTFVPSIRPPMVKGWFRKISGFTPAKTPTEALDKFREAIKNRDYETAAEYCDKDYKEQMLKAAVGAKKLGDAIDSLVYNMDTKGVVNAKTKLTLYYLEPFPKTFKVLDIKPKDIKETDKTAFATVAPDEVPVDIKQNPLPPDFLLKHRNMLGALLPVEYLHGGFDTIELVKEETGFWKLKIPVTTRLRLSVDDLKANATNYANAVYLVRDEVKNNPVTKENVQATLEQKLNESK